MDERIRCTNWKIFDATRFFTNMVFIININTYPNPNSFPFFGLCSLRFPEPILAYTYIYVMSYLFNLVLFPCNYSQLYEICFSE